MLSLSQRREKRSWRDQFAVPVSQSDNLLEQVLLKSMYILLLLVLFRGLPRQFDCLIARSCSISRESQLYAGVDCFLILCRDFRSLRALQSWFANSSASATKSIYGIWTPPADLFHEECRTVSVIFQS